MEEPAFLAAVQRIVGGVEVEDDLLWRLGVGVEEQIDEQRLDRAPIDGDLPVTVARTAWRMLQPVDGALAGQGRTPLAPRRQPVGPQRQDRIEANVVVVVDVLVAQRKANDALADQGAQGVDHPLRAARVTKAGRNPPAQPDGPVGLAQQQRPGIRRQRSAVKRRHHPPAGKAFELELVCATLRLHRTPLSEPGKSFSQNNFLRFPGPMHLPR